MAQEDLKPNEKGNRIRPQGGSDDQKRGPRFNIYWIWAAIAVILIGFNLFQGKFTPTAEDTTEQDFQTMLLRGDVEKIDIITNKDLVKIYIKKDSLRRDVYQSKLAKRNTPPNDNGPQFQFSVDSKIFADNLRAFYQKYPNLQQVPQHNDKEGDWVAPALNILLPIIAIILIMVLFMRKMGSGGGGAGGPGGIFNIGKSKATLFDIHRKM